MRTEWLEDFLLLLETGNFSRAAERRNLSQPAFSRRIQALENWLGVHLVERDRKPLKFTPLALAYQAEIRNLHISIHRLRSQMLAEEAGTNRIIVAAQHTLTTTFLPRLIRRLESGGLHHAYRIRSANKWDGVTLLIQGLVQFLMCYESVSNPKRLPSTMNRVIIGQDRLRLVSAVNNSVALYDAAPEKPLPLLSYPQDSFFGQILWDERLPQLIRLVRVETVCESAFAPGLRELVLNGLGVGWLPESLIRDDLSTRQLVALDHVTAPCDLDIVIYSHRHGANPAVERIWEFLRSDHESG